MCCVLFFYNEYWFLKSCLKLFFFIIGFKSNEKGGKGEISFGVLFYLNFVYLIVFSKIEVS